MVITFNSVGLEWTDFTNFIENAGREVISSFVLERLYFQKDTKDFTLVSEDGVAEAKCHSMLLKAHSPVFTAMLDPKKDMKERQLNKVKTIFSSEAIGFFVRYIYSMGIPSTTVSCELALELLRLADLYEVKELEWVLSGYIQTVQTEWFTPDGLVGLFIFTQNLQEFKHLRPFILRIIGR